MQFDLAKLKQEKEARDANLELERLLKGFLDDKLKMKVLVEVSSQWISEPGWDGFLVRFRPER